MNDIKTLRHILATVLVFFAITVIGMYFNKIESIQVVEQRYSDSLIDLRYQYHADSIDWHNAELIYQERLKCK